KLIEQWQRDTACATRGKAGSAISDPVFLSILEFVKESILEDINFVDVLGTPGVRDPVTNVTSFERGAFEDLLLEADVPLVHIGSAKVWISRPQTAGSIDQEIITVGD